MIEIEHGRFTCDACRKSYRWRRELAGRKVMCKCGGVMICPAQEPGDERQDLYDLVPPIDEAPKAAQVAPPLDYRKPRDEVSAVDHYFPDRIRDLFAPLWLIAGSSVVLVIVTLIFGHGPGVTVASALAAVAARIVVGTMLMLTGIFTVAKVRHISFGPFWPAVLKLAALSIAPEAITWLIWPLFAFIPMIGALFVWGIEFSLYFALLGAFFDLDEGDTWYCMCVIIVLNLGVYFAIRAGLFGFLMNY